MPVRTPLQSSLKCRLALPRPLTYPKGYPVHLGKIGDHLRKKRLDLGLLQAEDADMIGVTESTVWNWEQGTEPELIHIPAVLTFLGYMPWEVRTIQSDGLAYFKKVNGLSLRRLGALMGGVPRAIRGLGA